MDLSCSRWCCGGRGGKGGFVLPDFSVLGTNFCEAVAVDEWTVPLQMGRELSCVFKFLSLSLSFVYLNTQDGSKMCSPHFQRYRCIVYF